MNTWWQVADMLEAEDIGTVEAGLKVVSQSEMPEDVKDDAKFLLQEIDQLRRKLQRCSRDVLANMDGVMWPVI